MIEFPLTEKDRPSQKSVFKEEQFLRRTTKHLSRYENPSDFRSAEKELKARLQMINHSVYTQEQQKSNYYPTHN